ncbi:MAG: nitrate ABC transporter substrate-binding protein [Chloroflexi bacterium 13_1_40CM_4_68_4]|nr:MAG: nitrate ABC transporter substrate-binding protein [Chloroflexi bacterium 13_1_40CM_4_68_4]
MRHSLAVLGIIAILVIAACGGAGTPGGSASPSPNEKVSLTIMVGGLNKQIYLPNMLTEKLGYFKDQNLDVTLIDEPSGKDSTTALLASEVEAASGSYDHTIDVAGLGKNLIEVVQLLRAPGEAEMVATTKANDIKSAADFKGKKLGVTSIGSGTHGLTQYLAVKNNIAVTDFTPVPVGAGDTFIAAIKQGTIDAGMTTEPTISRLLKSGDAKVLIDLRTPDGTKAALGGDYPFISLYMRSDWVASHKPAVQRLVNAYVKTLKWIQTHSPDEIAAQLPADYYAGDKQLYLDALKGSLPMFSPDGKMPAGAPDFILKVLQTYNKNVQGKTIDLAKTWTNEFADAAK